MNQDLETLSREAEQIVKSIGIPPCPALLAKLVREMRSDDPDFNRLGTLISSDVSLAAALLKTVNSPFYGLRSKATSIRQALVMVGLRNVTQLVTGLLLRQAFPAAGAHLEEFWKYSSGVARVTALLARRVRGVDADFSYTFALFRDCGVPAMMGGFASYVAPYAAESPAGRSVTEVEEETFGIHHAYMGYHLAKEWLLAEPVYQAVLCHHDYAALRDGGAEIDESGARVIALALAAEYVYTHHAMSAKCVEWAQHGDYALEQIGMTADELEEIVPELSSALAD